MVEVTAEIKAIKRNEMNNRKIPVLMKCGCQNAGDNIFMYAKTPMKFDGKL